MAQTRRVIATICMGASRDDAGVLLASRLFVASAA
jgi:hypothetical protein